MAGIDEAVEELQEVFFISSLLENIACILQFVLRIELAINP